jgi:protein-tyrosine-phosphatase
MIRTIFVCTANRCRSMMAEGIMRARWEKVSGRGLAVSSMGIHGMDNLPPMDFAIRVCSDYGIDISNQRSRPLVPEELKRADLVLAMEPVQKDFLRLFYPHLDDKIFLLGSWPDRNDSAKAGVKDPVGGTLGDYRKTYEILSGHVDRIIPLLRGEYGI